VFLITLLMGGQTIEASVSLSPQHNVVVTWSGFRSLAIISMVVHCSSVMSSSAPWLWMWFCGRRERLLWGSYVLESLQNVERGVKSCFHSLN
jgi:hypothetical protein